MFRLNLIAFFHRITFELYGDSCLKEILAVPDLGKLFLVVNAFMQAGMGL